MKAISIVAFIVAALSASASIAAETTINYQGVVSATPDLTQSYDLVVGTPVYFSVTFDPDNLVYVSNTIVTDDAITGLPVYIPNLQAASLSDDPNAAFSVTLGSHTFNKTDDYDYGSNAGLGTTDFPIAFVQNSTFVGVAFGAEDNSDGFVANFDPLSVPLNYQPTYGIGGDNNSPNPQYGFLITTDLPAVQISAAPEPASWAMMICGVGMTGVAMRRRRKVATPASYAA